MNSQPTPADLLPPLHDVDPPAMRVSLEAITDRAAQLRRSRRRRTALEVVAACAVGAAVVGGYAATRSDHSAVAPASQSVHSSSPIPHLGLYFYGAPHDGRVSLPKTSDPIDSDDGGQAPTVSYRARVDRANRWHLSTVGTGQDAELTMKAETDGSWSARHQGQSLRLVPVAPDVSAVLGMGNESNENAEIAEPGDTSGIAVHAPVVLPTGQTAVLVSSSSREPGPIALRHSNGSWTVPGHQVYTARIAQGETVLVPSAHVEALVVNSGGGISASPSRLDPNQPSCSNDGDNPGSAGDTVMMGRCLYVVPDTATDVSVATKDKAVHVTQASAPGSGCRVILGSRQYATDATDEFTPITSVSWTQDGVRHTAKSGPA